jgi:hypothetical protein
MRWTVLSSIFLLLFVVGYSLTADATALRIVVVQTDNPTQYVQELEKGKALMKKAGSPVVLRVWQARFAGDQTGTVVASAEYPDLAALAAEDARMAENAELREWLKGLDKIRKIVSDSIYMELKP